MVQSSMPELNYISTHFLEEAVHGRHIKSEITRWFFFVALSPHFLAYNMARARLSRRTAKHASWSTGPIMRNGRVVKGWLLQTSTPDQTAKHHQPYKGKKDMMRGTTPAEAWWWLFRTKKDAMNAKEELRSNPKNKTMRLSLKHKNALKQGHYYW